MAGITNVAFRQLCREQGEGVFVCEMVTTQALVERNPKTLRMIAFGEENPRSLQLYGVDPQVTAAAVRRVGVRFLDAVNRLDRGPAAPRTPGLGFAAGGLVAARGAAAAPPVSLSFRIAPEALHMTLSDWLEGELARIAASR